MCAADDVDAVCEAGEDDASGDGDYAGGADGEGRREKTLGSPT